MRMEDYERAGKIIAERERLAEEMIDLTPSKGFERRILYTDETVRTWRISGRKCLRCHEHETVSVRLTMKDAEALRRIRDERIRELSEELERLGVEVDADD